MIKHLVSHGNSKALDGAFGFWLHREWLYSCYSMIFLFGLHLYIEILLPEAPCGLLLPQRLTFAFRPRETVRIASPQSGIV